MQSLYCHLRLSLCVLIMMLFSAQSNNVYALEYTDAVGRIVHFPAPPQRIVSLVPSVTEILYAIDADDQLVGVTDFCNYPARAQQKISIGAYDSPSLETVASLAPDLIVMDVAGSTPALLHQFEQLRVPVYLVAPKSLESTLATILSLGAVTGHLEVARALVNKLKAQIDAVKAMHLKNSPRTLVCVMIEPLIVAGGGTLAGDLIDTAGGVNVASGLARYPTVSMETILQFDPDVIIVSPHPGTENPRDFFLQWPQLRAVAHQHIIDVEADLLQRPGPRLVDGLQSLARYYCSIKQELDVEVNRAPFTGNIRRD